ncbi:MAG: type I restriction enzyme HsdR N-terminal domain-containing protein, partial [Patescibacteria group bacterium]
MEAETKNQDLSILKDLHSEEDVKSKVTIPYFKRLGYKDSQIFLNVPIKAYLGRQSKVVYADLVIREKSTPIIIVEVKKPGTQHNEIQKEQA